MFHIVLIKLTEAEILVIKHLPNHSSMHNCLLLYCACVHDKSSKGV